MNHLPLVRRWFEEWRPRESRRMSKTILALTEFAAGAHRALKALADAYGTFLVDLFHYLALFAIGGTTVWSAIMDFLGMVNRGRATLSDILLLFIYLEIGAMIGIYFRTTRLPVRYLIYIAITVLARVLIEIVSAEHRTGMDLLIVAGAIMGLSLAVLVLRYNSGGFPLEEQPAAASKHPHAPTDQDGTG